MMSGKPYTSTLATGTLLEKARHAFFKTIHGRRIFSSPPIPIDTSSDYEIHIVTCKRDAMLALWSLKSFLHFTGLNTRLIIHNDGTIDATLTHVFTKHFPGCKIIGKQEANAAMQTFLRDYEHCRLFRLGRFSKVSLKLFDCIYYSEAKHILILDSDMLFFSAPREIMEHLKNNRMFFMPDRQNAYCFPVDVLENILKSPIIQQVNTGVMHWSRVHSFDLNLIESFLKVWHENKHPSSYWAEQTSWALLLSKHHENVSRLSKHHQISFQPITSETISHHFVSNGARERFYRDGVRHLINSGFLKNLRIRTLDATAQPSALRHNTPPAARPTVIQWNAK